MTKTVKVDSDAIFAIYNPNDPLKAQAIQTFQELANKGYQLIYSSSVIFEVVSLFQRVLPTPTVTAKITDLIKNDNMFIKVVDGDILKESATLFNPTGSNKNILIDCSVVVITKKVRGRGSIFL